MIGDTTITSAQIRALSAEASRAGDDAMVNVCNTALYGALEIGGRPVPGPTGKTWTQIEAWAECERAIRAASAVWDGEAQS